MKPKPKHYWIQKVFLDETVVNTKVFVTAQNVQLKAEAAAKQPGIDVVLILKGSCDPNDPSTEDIVNRIEPRPFTEFGKPSIAVKSNQIMMTRKVGESTAKYHSYDSGKGAYNCGAVAQMNYKDSAEYAKRYGFVYWRKAVGSHELWIHPNGQTLLMSAHKPGRAGRNFQAEVRRKAAMPPQIGTSGECNG